MSEWFELSRCLRKGKAQGEIFHHFTSKRPQWDKLDGSKVKVAYVWSNHYPARVNITLQHVFPPYTETMYFLPQVNAHYLHLIVSAPPFPGCFDGCGWLHAAYKHYSLYFSVSLKKPILQLKLKPHHPCGTSPFQRSWRTAIPTTITEFFLNERSEVPLWAAALSLDATFPSMGAVK